MLNIFKYLKEAKLKVVFIIGLLIVQAVCDLSLPTYTADIVDIGISKSGIEETIPEKIRKTELDKLTLFLDEETGKDVKDAYQATDEEVDGDVVYELTLNSSEETELSKRTTDAVAFLGMMSMESASTEDSKASDSSSAMNAEEQKQMQEMMMRIMTGQTTADENSEFVKEIFDKYDTMRDTMTSQLSSTYIKSEYEAINIDMAAKRTNYLLITGLKMLGVSLIAMLTSIIVGLIAAQVAAGVSLNLRNKFFNKVVSFSNVEFDKFSTASLITRNTNDIQQVQMVLVMLLRMVIYAPILAIGGIYKVVQTNLSMGWIIFVGVAAIMCVVAVLFSVAMPKFKLMQTLVDKLNLVAREILTGLPVIRAFSREKHEEKRFDGANKELMKTQLFTNRVMTFMMPIMMLIMNGITLLIIWFGAKGIDSGDMMVGDMMAFLTYTMQIVMSFLMITMVSIMLPRAGVAAKRINEVIETEVEISDPKDAQTPAGKGIVKFDNVSFRYPNAESNVLSNISFEAKPGETTAIIGSTGSGKSTLINLIPRFYDVTEGQILVDGIDIRKMKQSNLRDEIGYVPQKGILFSGTISSNLRFGKEDATDEEVIKAAEIAQAMEFISSKEDGIDSEISQGGTNVSGGQKQRLSIARAIAKNPKIFIFDDSFSALDFKTDVTLRKALKNEISDSTVIIVAQRISTILNAEQIIVLDEGNVVGIGTHSWLLKNCPVYAQIAASQLSESELADSVVVDSEEAAHE